MFLEYFDFLSMSKIFSIFTEALTMNVRYGEISEKQEDAITKVLLEIFCFKKSTVTLFFHVNVEYCVCY